MSARQGGLPQAAGSVRWTVVQLPAEVDLRNSAAAGAELAGAAAAGITVIGDMSQTRFCDSSAVATLIRASKAVAAAGADLRLIVTAPAVLRVLALTGADTILSVHGSLAEATGNRANRTKG